MDSQQPSQPGQPGAGRQPTADPDSSKLIQQQLVLLLHAVKCQRGDMADGDQACSLPHCRTMKNVLNHMTTCSAEKECQVAHCASSRQIITHWKNCICDDCPVCMPLKHASDRRNTTAGGMSAPPTQSTALQQLMASQPSLAQGMAPPHSTEGLGNIAQSSRMTKDWHQHVTQDLCNHLDHKLVQAIFPTPDPAALKDSRMKNLVAYARKMEGDKYETANSLSVPPGGGGGGGSFNFSSAPGHPSSTTFNAPLSNAMTTTLPITSPPLNMLANAINKPGQPGQPGAGRQPTADPDKSKLIQQQLVHLHHFVKCQRGDMADGDQACSLPYCRTMKDVLNHMTTCSAEKECQDAHCASLRQIIKHWKNCTRSDCPVCLPLKYASDRRNTTAGGLQQNAINLPQTCDANDDVTSDAMNRAYDALGLRYNKSATTTTPQIPHQQVPSGLQPGGMSAPPTQSTAPQQLMASQPSLAQGMAPPFSTERLENIAQSSRMTKDWHQHVTQDLRNHLVHKLVQAMFPTPDPAALKDSRMKNLVAYARKVEGDMYETANSREKYYHLLAEKISKIQKELEEKRMNRMRQNTPQGPPMGGAQKSSKQTTDWRQGVTQDLREHLVNKLIQAKFPTTDPAALKDSRMKNLVAYARKVEGDMYETANSREQYFQLLAEFIYNIEKELVQNRPNHDQKRSLTPEQCCEETCTMKREQ